MAKIVDYIKNLFWILLILQLAPPLFKSVQSRYSSLWETKTKVGLISIKGLLYDSTKYIKQLRKFFTDKQIKALLIKIECPGGAAGTAQIIFNEIKELKKNVAPKLVVMLIENIAASGGYYIASAGDYIVAPPSAIIGSIGAYISHPDFKDFIEYHNIKYDLIRSGAYKGAGNPLVALTAQDKELLQSLTNSSYEQFTKDIAEQRAKAKIPADRSKWADGKLFTGNQAFELGLIDKVGSLSNAITLLKEHAPIVGEIEWVKPPKKYSFFSSFFGTDEDRETSFMSNITQAVCQAVETRYAKTGVTL